MSTLLITAFCEKYFKTALVFSGDRCFAFCAESSPCKSTIFQIYNVKVVRYENVTVHIIFTLLFLLECVVICCYD